MNTRQTIFRKYLDGDAATVDAVHACSGLQVADKMDQLAKKIDNGFEISKEVSYNCKEEKQISLF